MTQMPSSPAFVELPVITTALLGDIERLNGLTAHQTAAEERGCWMPISIDSGSSSGKVVREASGRFVCGRSYEGGGKRWVVFTKVSLPRPHLDTHTNTHTS